MRGGAEAMAMARPQPSAWHGLAAPRLPRPAFGRRSPTAQPGLATWQRGDGDAELVGADTPTLLLRGTGLTAAAVAAAILPDRAGRRPAPEGDAIDITGLSGRLLVGAELIRFRGFRRLVVEAA
jgi:hypothetical protein